jgi:hypothetical protein
VGKTSDANDVLAAGEFERGASMLHLQCSGNNAAEKEEQAIGARGAEVDSPSSMVRWRYGTMST